MDRASLTSPGPPSYAFLASSSAGLVPDQLESYTTPVSIHGAPSRQDAYDFSQQYQHHQQYFQDQSQHYSNHLNYQHTAFQDQTNYDQYNNSRKRQKVELDMHCFPFSRPTASQNDQEKSPGSDYPDDEGCSRGTIFQSFGNFVGSVCAPSSEYGAAPGKPFCPHWRAPTNLTVEGYQTISPMYEAPISRAYSADLQSPSDLSRHLNLSSSGPELSVAPNLVDSANVPAFTEQHPPLQPARHTQMRYQAPQDVIPSLETNSPFMKQEKPAKGEDFQHHANSTNPTYMYSASSSHPTSGMEYPDPVPYPQHDMARYQTQYPVSHGFMSAGAIHQESFDYFPLPSQGNELGMMTPTQKPAPTRRGPFKDPQARIRTAQTRKMGSCIRCRMQRIRVRLGDMLQVME